LRSSSRNSAQGLANDSWIERAGVKLHRSTADRHAASQSTNLENKVADAPEVCHVLERDGDEAESRVVAYRVGARYSFSVRI
jgi:ABC-type xylose transport system substrate-binding protein